MNFLLSLNKKLFLFVLFLILFLFLIILSIIYINSNIAIENNTITINKKSADITKPKFAINSDKQKISVTANEGNFLTDDEIMLEKNVVFKSTNFKIFSENVIFNKKNLIAYSKNKSKFVSENASIESIGFDIIENGNIISFKGKTKLKLK